LGGELDDSWKGIATDETTEMPELHPSPGGDSNGGESGRKTEEKESGDSGKGIASGEQLLVVVDE
jgi:hypothetical protein